jgi:hypothetical protein
MCRRYGVLFFPALAELKIGIAENVRTGGLKINGLRHPPQGDTTGWYVWAGESLPERSDFFRPLHVTHLHERCPAVVKYLGLPPGWRFLIAHDYEDVWYDATLQDV